ncbi:alpha/beta fold hydrolase [Kribbella soli]|uniref:Alpha/beta hydrolase n=1 Tax=Kribbella soli TaxID=1124743 RepID=A0A4R0H7E6_9ACTN|nr:alpha/beta hydrolase [Kribbella soli]TCC06321.1 alpha/beta hydrolase [Kribbella soli]
MTDSVLTTLEQAVSALVHELRPRCPEYLREHEIRILVPTGVELGDGSRMVAEIGAALGLTLVTARDDAEANAVDRLLTARLDDAAGRLAELDATPAEDLAALIARSGTTPPSAQPDLDWQELAVGGERMRFATVGTRGTPVVLINALAQAPDFWFELIDRLLPRRVVLFQCGGVLEDDVRPEGLSVDQLRTGLEGVLDHLGHSTHHLVGWCTGARFATRLAHLRPDLVASLTMLNGAFKQLGADSADDSAYERVIETMCRTVENQPELADQLAVMVSGSVGRPSAGPDGDRQAAGRAALAGVDPAFNDLLRAPVRDGIRLRRYAHQLFQLFSEDPFAMLPPAGPPVLCIAGEYDEQVSLPRFARVAATIPDARFATVAGGTHFLLHDRPDLVAELLTDLFAGIAPRPATQEISWR